MIAKITLLAIAAVALTSPALALPPTTHSPTDVRSEALRLEGEHDWNQALELWESWRPQSGCGTCNRQMYSEKTYHVAANLLRMGETQKATSTCLDAVFGEGRSGEAQVSLLLLSIYKSAGQVSNLVAMVDACERQTLADYRLKGHLKNISEDQALRGLPTWPIRAAQQIEEHKIKGEITNLIAIAQASSWTSTDTTQPSEASRDWRCQLAAKALAEMGESAVEPICAEVVKPKANFSWLIYALGLSKATNALIALERGARQEASYNSINFVCAISKHGDEGRQLLGKIANEWTERMQNGIRVKAQLFLAQQVVFPDAGLDFPPIKQGSLPSTFHKSPQVVPDGDKEK